MKKDLNNQLLNDEQLGIVQGGVGEGEGTVSTHCLHPRCDWSYIGPKSKAALAQQNHTKETGHTDFE